MNMFLPIIKLGVKFMEYLLDLWQVVKSDGKSVCEGKQGSLQVLIRDCKVEKRQPIELGS